MYKIELSNGRIIENVKINGTVFTTTQAVNAATFSGGLYRIKITQTVKEESDELSLIEPGEYEKLKLGDVYADRWNPGKYNFMFDFLTDDDMKEMMTDARLSYLEMLIEGEGSMNE